jgi:hypothetical protein
MACTDASFGTAHPACHGRGDQWRLSDSHDCADHAPQAALVTSRAPVADTAAPAIGSFALAEPNAAWSEPAAVILFAESAGPPGFRKPLRV